MGEQPISKEEREMLLRLNESIQGELRLRKGGPTPAQTDTQGTTDFSPGAQGFELGLQREEGRLKMRAAVESLPPTMQFLVEMAPSTVGTTLGFIGGGGLGSVATGSAGGLAGEAIGQDIGISPRSDLGLGLAAAGPVAGPLVGKGLQKIGKGVGKGFTSFIPARVAIAKKSMREAATEFESLGTKILGNQKGLMRVSSERLYKLANEAKVQIPIFRLSESRKAFAPLRQGLNKFKHLDAAKGAVALLDDIEKTLSGSTVSFNELLTVKELVGTAIGQAKSAGVKTSTIKGLEKQFFKAVQKDFDHLAGLGGKTGNVGKIAKAAGQRAKLDFAIKDLQQGVAQFTRWEDGLEVLSLNTKGMREWIRKSTNPHHKQYNKSMSEALKDDLPAIMENLKDLTRFTNTNAGGPGSLIVRGAGAAAGASLGSPLGMVGAGAGAIIGARTPEILTGILSSPTALRVLMKAANAGKGEISLKTWQIAGQIAAQAGKTQEPNRSPLVVGAP
jgi:hypothetical protein